MRNNLLLSLLIIVYSTSLMGQQISSWSSFYENGFIWNPALSSNYGNKELSLTHRSEWSGFEDAPEFGTLSYQSPLTRDQNKASIGTFLEYDKAGPLQNIALSGTYAYKIKPQLLKKENDLLSFGLLIKVQQLRLNTIELVHPELQLSGASELPNSTSIQPNVGFGFHYVSASDKLSDRYYFGFSMLNMIPNKLNTIEGISLSSSMHITSNLGYRKFLSSSKAILDINLLGIYAATRPYDIMLNMRYEKVNKFWLSAGLVNTGEFFGQFGVILGKRSGNSDASKNSSIRLGIKADYSIGSISRVAGLGYEFYMAYRFGSNQKEITDKGYKPSRVY